MPVPPPIVADHTKRSRQRTADETPLLIHVDNCIRLDIESTPKAIIEALRRQLRRHDAGRSPRRSSTAQPAIQLLWNEAGNYCLPQALLGQLVEICRRNQLRCVIRDERSLVSCPRLRSLRALSATQSHGLRQLLLRDGGVLVARDPTDRIAVTAELIARREQRTLVVTVPAAREVLCRALASALGSPADMLASRDNAEGARIVVDSYAGALTGNENRSFGFIVFDALEQVDPIVGARAICTARARYILGLAGAAARLDGLHGPLFFALGGWIHEIAPARAERPARLAYRRRLSAFSFDYAGREHYQALLAMLAIDPARNRLIVADVVGEARAGQRCVVLSERRDQLEEIAKLLPEDIRQRSEVITSAVRPAARSAITLRFARGERDVLLVTSQIASESSVMRRATRLFVAFPFSYGRKLERILDPLLHPDDYNAEVLVFDYDDPQIGPLHRACDKRSGVVAKLQRHAEATYQTWAQTTFPF